MNANTMSAMKAMQINDRVNGKSAWLRTGLVGVFLGLALVLSSAGQARAEGQTLAELESEKETELRRLERATEDLAESQEEASELQARGEQAAEIAEFLENADKEKADLEATIDESEANAKRLMRLLQTYQRLGGADTDIKAGDQLGDISLADGRQLKGAVVSRVENGNIGLRHSSGVGTFAVGELPEEIARRFMVPPVSAFPGSLPDLQRALAMRPGAKNAVVGGGGEIATSEQPAKDGGASAHEVANANFEAYKKKKQELMDKMQEAEEKQVAAKKAYYAAVRAMRDKKYEMNYGSNTKVSSADQQKILVPYEQRVAALEKARSDWGAEANRLYRELKALKP